MIIHLHRVSRLKTGGIIPLLPSAYRMCKEMTLFQLLCVMKFFNIEMKNVKKIGKVQYFRKIIQRPNYRIAH